MDEVFAPEVRWAFFSHTPVALRTRPGFGLRRGARMPCDAMCQKPAAGDQPVMWPVRCAEHLVDTHVFSVGGALGTIHIPDTSWMVSC